MMNESCPVLSPTEKQYADIQERAEQAMWRRFMQRSRTHANRRPTS